MPWPPLPAQTRQIKVQSAGAPPLKPRRPKPQRPKPLLVAAASLLVIAAAATVIVLNLPSNFGTLIVESEDPAIEVRVKGDEVKLLHGEKNYTLKLKPGKFTVEIPGDKVIARADTTEFTLERGGKVTVRVRLEAKGIAGKTPSATIAPKLNASPLDSLRHENIPATERLSWQPKDLVAVLGTHSWQHLAGTQDVGFSPTARQLRGPSERLSSAVWELETRRRSWPSSPCPEPLAAPRTASGLRWLPVRNVIGVVKSGTSPRKSPWRRAFASRRTSAAPFRLLS